MSQILIDVLDAVLVGSIAAILACVVVLSVYYRPKSTQGPQGVQGSGAKSKTELRINNAGLSHVLTPARLMIVRIAVAGLAYFIVGHVLGTIITIVITVLSLLIPGAILKYLAKRRQSRYSRDLVYVLRYMLTLLSSGNSLEQAIDLLAARYAPDTYKPALTQVSRDLRNAGLREAMMGAQRTVSNAVFDRMVGYFLVNSELGAELIPLLETAQDQIETQDKMAAELSATTAQTRLGAYFVPIALGGLVLGEQLLSGPNGYWQPYYTFVGQIVELVLFGFFGVGFMVMRGLLNLPEGERIEYYVGGGNR